jgi:SAM-dependent methyltransferase
MIGDGERWQLEGDAPELYERYLVPAVTLPWAVDLVERMGVRRGDRVLDVACGTGAVARVAAARVGEAGRVAGLDVKAACSPLPVPRLWRALCRSSGTREARSHFRSMTASSGLCSVSWGCSSLPIALRRCGRCGVR